MKKFSKVLLFLLLCVAISYGVWRYFYTISSTDKAEVKLYITRTDWIASQKLIESIKQAWDQPDRLNYINWKDSECPYWDFKNYHQAVDLRQNYLVLKCILENKVKQTTQQFENDKFTQLSVKKPDGSQEKYFLKNIDNQNGYFKHLNLALTPGNEYLPFEGIYFVMGKSSDNDFEFTFTLSADQKLVYLPQANYFYAQDVNQLPHKYKNDTKNVHQFANVQSWDNLGRHFLIDKMPVRNFELQLLLDFELLKNKLATTVLAPELISNYLTLEVQKQYCASRGMQLLDAAVFDAATFYRDIRNFDSANSRSLFYFGQRWPVENRCRLQKTIDCKNDKSDLEISWMGLLSFTSDFEALNNNFDPFYNLKAGSNYFKLDSAWQFLGNRMHWNGQAHGQEDFKWISSIMGNPLERAKFDLRLPVQFRCMKEWVSYPND